MGRTFTFLFAAAFLLVAHAEDDTFTCLGTNCIYVPPTCNNIKCTLGASFTMTENGTLDVHAAASNVPGDSYVAVGFSKDEQMGNDVVVMCVPNSSPEASILLMKNPGGHNPPEPVSFVTGTAPSGNTKKGNNRVDCSFHMPLRFDAGNGLNFDLMKEDVTIFVVTGLYTDGKPQKHQDTKVIGMVKSSQLNGSPSLKVSLALAISTIFLALLAFV